MLKFLKRKDKKKKNEPEYEIINGMWDKTKRTKAGMRHLITLLSLIVIFVVGVMLYGYKSHDYKMYQMNNTTEIGSDLKFTKSESTVKIDDVWTDENRDVTVVKLGYDNKARDLLSTKGKNYNLYMVTDGDKPDVKLKYGMLGTEGDGFLFIKGKLDKKAYQLYIANTVELTTGQVFHQVQKQMKILQLIVLVRQKILLKSHYLKHLMKMWTITVLCYLITIIRTMNLK